jgi:hypothetical protein
LQHELKEKADEFYTVSSMPGKMFHGCVGAIDGWLTIINKPNVTKYIQDCHSTLICTIVLFICMFVMTCVVMQP